MKRYIHTTKGVRSGNPVKVITYSSESGTMLLTISTAELENYEMKIFGLRGAMEILFPITIKDEAFGAILKDLRDDGTLEEEYIHERE